MKMIDFRLRPPSEPYKGFFFKEGVASCCRSFAWDVSPSYLKSLEGEKGSADDQALEILYEEMDKNEIEIGVMNGRHSDRLMAPCHVEDAYMAQLEKDSSGRLVGLAGVNFDQSIDEIVAGIETGVRDLGMKGVCMEPGLAATPMYADDERLTPIYQKCLELGVPLLMMTGPFSGPDISYTNPVYYEKVAVRFPRLPIILGHGCYPFVNEAVALAFRSGMLQNVYVSPDIYMFAPGGEAFVQGVNFVPGRFLFASAYPFGNLDAVVEKTMALPIKKEVLPRFVYSNAAKLLKL